MREYERYEPLNTPPRSERDSMAPPPARSRRRPPKVNKAAVMLGDPLVVFGGFLRVLSRRRK